MNGSPHSSGRINGENVELRGQIDNATLAEVYQRTYLFERIPYRWLFCSPMEALACGTPALVSDIPSNLEWVRMEEGWVFRDGDDTDLARKILHIAAHPDLRTAAAVNAREKAERNANWEKNFSILLDGYVQAMKEGQR